ncbi:MAG: [FeFe] hydrogenase H-cluster maturation GTPase HydF [Bacteroidales bacterium]|nr:[FeFe] hydrogenase H-cluster maturation GTPase HydF [Bacteroidales bacterium]
MTPAPESHRLHIVLLGNRNSGKSSLLNAIAAQEVSIVSDTPGTTTDSVSKAMEIPGLGPCSLVDTAGLDDSGLLGGKRVKGSLEALKSADIILAVLDADSHEIPELPETTVPVLPVINKTDLCEPSALETFRARVEEKFGRAASLTVAGAGDGIGSLLQTIRESVPEDWDAPLLTEGLLEEGALAVLVMPQDRQAPKGRLILPQQQTIRELLDRKCRIVCCDENTLKATLDSLKETPDAIITDSSVMEKVSALKPEGTVLTSFSILLAAAKGDLAYFKESAKVIDSLTADSRVLIAEACTHVPESEDIGRVKIPRLLRARAGEGLAIDVVSGRDFPEDLGAYSLIIHCGACMFNRRYVLARVRQAREQGVPMTNYGITIAYIKNLL